MPTAEMESEEIAWVIRLREADAAGWEAFVAWLEADPAHAAVYDRTAATGAEFFLANPVANDDVPEEKKVTDGCLGPPPSPPR